ncbi:uncharacterized protein TNCT_454581 [Trichonephila clavata]|uniref:Paired domain-containing protein n=1 Tax=Trichonephila clavata TaxID=2740835 RepID=A0A8X6LHE3_TRICU|nr:uncharacterized protein TNCT_454581 [Trichonephila clavata]
MSSRRETTESERLLVVKWSKEGKSLREIASLIGVTHGCVQQILQKYKKTGSVANIPGRGRKEILSTTAKRKIIHSVKKYPREKFSYCRNVPGFRGNSSGIPGPEVDFGWKYPRKWNLAKDVFRRKDEKDRFVETVWSRLG